jgi:hypothetical protein
MVHKPGTLLGDEVHTAEPLAQFLHHWLESNYYNHSFQATIYIKRLSGWFVSRIGQTSKLDGIIAQHSAVANHQRIKEDTFRIAREIGES